MKRTYDMVILDAELIVRAAQFISIDRVPSHASMEPSADEPGICR